MSASPSLRRRHHPNYLNIIVIQRDRFQRSAASHFQQRREVLITNAAVETDVGLDGRTAQVAIEDRLGRLQAHALVVTIEQLAKALDRTRRQLCQSGSHSIGRFRPAAGVAAGSG
jgi:hypothetical protein